MSDIPEPWATRLIQRDFTDRRSTRSKRASLGALADKIGVNTTTISEAISGKRRPTVETVKALVRELGPDVAEWLGVPIREPYEPPPEADLLTLRQRKAITELIRSFVTLEQEGGGGHAERPAPTSRADFELLLSDQAKAAGQMKSASRRDEDHPPKGPREQPPD